jgi:hypothetical protein
MMASRALVLGVPRTTFGRGIFPELAGVYADVSSMTKVLKARDWLVEAPNAPADLTVKSVTQKLQEAVDSTRAGETTVIYLSGHGYRYPDRNGDEVDGWDESFVCADGAIEDDWFHQELWPRVHADARFVCMVDACHSEDTVIRIDAPKASAFPATVPGVPYYRLVLAACRDFETTIQVGPKDGGGGVVTIEALSVLRQMPEISYRILWPLVETRVRTKRGAHAGRPIMSSLGKDDQLVDSVAFRP